MKNKKNKFERIFEAVAFADVGEFNSAVKAVAGLSSRRASLNRKKRKYHEEPGILSCRKG